MACWKATRGCGRKTLHCDGRTSNCAKRSFASSISWPRPAKNSSTSSKPPSSDMVKPPKPPRKDGQKRKRGGQPGHEQHLRDEFPPEAIDHVVPYTLDCCPDCGGKLRPFERPADVLQQVEITETPTIVTEHQGLAYWCPHCHKLHCAPLPEAVEKAGLFGPRLTALVAFMKGVCHASFSTIRKFLRDVVGVTVSRGYLVKVIAKVSESLAQAYAELFERLPGEAVLNIDETGHKENREKFWTWCFRAQLLHAVPHRQVARLGGPDRGVGRRSSTACWAAITSVPTASTCGSSTCWCSSAWPT